MSEKKLTKNTSGNIAAGVAMAASIVPLVKPAIDAVRDYADKTIEERKSLLPYLCCIQKNIRYLLNKQSKYWKVAD